MATIIKIKRTTGSSAPSGLEQGELAYVYDTSNASTGAGGNGLRLFIGDHTSTSNAAIEIGGQYYKLLLDHTHGALTASSAVIVDSNKAIDELFIGNSATTGGTIKFNEGTNNGAHFVALKSPNSVASSVTFTLPSADGSSGHLLTTDGSGNLSFAAPASSNFTLAADSGSNDTFTTGQTLTFTGGTGIDTTVSDNELTFAIDSTVATLAGTQTLTNKTLTSPKLNENVALTATSTELNLLDGITAIADEDNMSSNSATALATQQSIKAYVDAQLTAEDLDLTTDSGTIDIDLDSETLTIAGGTGLDSSATGTTVTLAIDSTVTTLAGTQTLTNKTLTSPVLTTPQFNDTSANHQYVVAVSELAADRTVTLPLLTGNDQFTFDAHASTLTNKSIDLANNTLTGSLSEFNSALQSESFAGLAATQTLTNKTISGADNTLSNIGNSSLSNSSITFGDGSSSTAASLGGTVVIQGTTNEVEVSESSGTFTVGLPNNVTISGNLTVSGDTTTVNTATLAVEDPLINLATGNNSSDAVDIGFYGLYDTSGSQDLYAGLFRDAGDGKFKLFKDNQAAPTTTVNTSGTGYAVATLVANLEATTATLGGSDIISTDNTKTLTNKTIVAGNNTISGITSSHFASAVTLVINDSSGSAVKTIVGSAS